MAAAVHVGGALAMEPALVDPAVVRPAPPGSWWHEGERALQETIPGGREQAEGFHSQVVRPKMIPQHQDFFHAQPLVYLARADAPHGVSASVLAGQPGFATSPDAHTLTLRKELIDVGSRSKLDGLAVGEHIGMLGIQFHDRRRNRLNGRVDAVDDQTVRIHVDQSYGNCPKYIQRRVVDVAPQLSGAAAAHRACAQAGTGALPEHLARLVRAADTFFVASAYSGQHSRGVGADMSHRGGAAGFVRVQGSELVWADYAGNGMFQTLGNLVVDPRCSLLFVDFETGATLQIAGRAAVEVGPTAEGALPGAERLVRVRVSSWVHTPSELPIASHTWLDASPYNPRDGGHAMGDAGGQDEAATEALEVLSVRHEADGVKTFEVAAPAAGASGVRAGMHATFAFERSVLSGGGGGGGGGVDVTRTWTVSSWHAGEAIPPGGSFTISVKREPHGLVSRHLHDALRAGDSLRFVGFGGGFTLDSMVEQPPQPPQAPQPGGGGREAVEGAEGGGAPMAAAPVVLLGGGIGVTPLRAFLHELRATQPQRDVVVVLSVQQHEQAAFGEELMAMARGSGGRVVTVVTATRGVTPAASQPAPAGLPPVSSLSHSGVAAAGGAMRATGRVGAAELSALVPDAPRATVFMCGPAAFMAAMEGALASAGVDMRNVHTESFAY